MANYMLIAGCSHAAGSEIDGTLSSPDNRKASFGNRLAEMMNHVPINIARNGSSNGAIHRSVLNWFTLNQMLAIAEEHLINEVEEWDSVKIKGLVE